MTVDPREDGTKVIFTFDVEDTTTEDSCDALAEIARLMSDRSVPASFFLTGDKARVLERRNRMDVVEALAFHDVGYHSNHHSTHPTIAEYSERCGWSDGVDEIVAREKSGVEAVSRLFGRPLCGFATPGTAWAPQVVEATKRLRLPCHVHSFSRTPERSNPHWFQGVPCFARTEFFGPVEDSMVDGDDFAACLVKLADVLTDAHDRRAGVVQIYLGHPNMFVHSEYWDLINYDKGMNPPEGARLLEPVRRPSYVTRRMFGRLCQLIEMVAERDDVEIVRLTDLVASIDANVTVDVERLAAMRDAARSGVDRVIDMGISPAQLVYVLARQVVEPSKIIDGASVPEVLGPSDRRVVVEEPEKVEAFRFRELCGELCRHVAATGRLPTSVSTAQIELSLGSLLATLCSVDLSLAALSDDGMVVRVIAGEPNPATGDVMASHFARRVTHWLHRADLDPSRMARLTALQSWSIRAVAR